MWTTRYVVKASGIFLMLCATSATAESTAQSSAASARVSELSAALVGESFAVTAHSGRFVITSIEISGEMTSLLLRNIGDSTQVSLRLATAAAADISLAVGSTVQLIAESTGHMLIVAGKLIAFLPNEVGRSLLHHSRYQRGS